MSDYSFELPKTQVDLDDLVQRLHAYSERKEFSRALTLCQHLIINKSTRMVGYRERAEIWQDMSEHDLAIYDLKQLAASGSVEPADYYNLGIALLRNTEAKEAVGAFTKAIDLSVEHQSTYYTQSCKFHRAAALLRLGMPKEALEDCNDIEDGYKCFLASEGLKTKEDLVAQAQKQM